MTTSQLQRHMTTIDPNITIEKPWPDRIIARDHVRSHSSQQTYCAQQFIVDVTKTAEEHCEMVHQWFEKRRKTA